MLGAGFNERTSYLWDPSLLAGRKIVQIDNDANQLEKVFDAEWRFAAISKRVLRTLLDEDSIAQPGMTIGHGCRWRHR